MAPAKELPGGSKVVRVTVAAEPRVKRYQATSAEPDAIAPCTKSRRIEGDADRSVRSGAALRTLPAATLSSWNWLVQLGAAGTVRVSSASSQSGQLRRRPDRVRLDGLKTVRTDCLSIPCSAEDSRSFCYRGDVAPAAKGWHDGGEVRAISRGSETAAGV